MMMDTNVRIDETSCGQVVCQHPSCWLSNRRVERGLPMTRYETEGTGRSTSDEELPTMKVLNMIGEYGFDPGDRYPTQRPLPRRRPPHPRSDEEDQAGRSHSAPIVRQLIDQPQQNTAGYTPKHMPITPHQTPNNQTPTLSQGTPQKAKSPTKQRLSNKSAPARCAPFSYLELVNGVKKVDMRDALGVGGLKHQGVIPPSKKVFVWCPSSPHHQETTDASQGRSEDSATKTKIHPKDVTEDMIPKNLNRSQNTNQKLRKKPPNFQTPTGGRPYTHPARSPPPLTRRTLPQDFDEGISQLLQLPREVLLELLEHTKESDLFDKNKVAMLLEKLMPHIHFEKNDVTQQHPPVLSPVNLQQSPQGAAPSAPLHSSGILRQKKVTLLDGRQKRADPIRAPPPTRSMPFFLDESGMSGITSSSYTRRERPDHQADEDRETTLVSPTIASEEVTKRKSLGPIRGAPTEMSNYSRRKLTSVSAKTLPPLQPGVRSIRPFNYTSQSFDLALSPLTTPDYEPSEKPSTPYSGIASTVYVTVPSQLSGHTPPQTPCTVCERTPIPPIPRMGSAHYSTISSVPSDDFNAIHEGVPTHVFRVPYATSDEGKQGGYPRDDITPSGATRILEQVDIVNLPPGSSIAASSVVPATDAAGDDAVGLNNVPQSRSVRTASAATGGTYSVQSPPKPPESSNTPYDAATSVMAQASEKAIGSPLALDTPLPTAPTPEVWPSVDEREYMKSPERKMERLSNKQIDMILAPVAPPPSPEPAGMDMDYDIQEMSNKSTTTPSLTPLAEEEEEEEEEEEDLRGDSTVIEAVQHLPDTIETYMHSPGATLEASKGSTEAEGTGTTSRGYLGDDEDAENSTPGGNGVDQTDNNIVKEPISDEQTPAHHLEESKGLESSDSTFGNNTLVPVTEVAEDTLPPLTEEAAEDAPVTSSSNQGQQNQPDQEGDELGNELSESTEQAIKDQPTPS